MAQQVVLNQRITYIDIAKGIAIILMILCHAGMHNGFTQWIYAFHMPLFFVLSGFLYSGSKTRMWPYVKRKFFQLIVPYFLFAMMLCFGNRGVADWPFILYGSRDSLFSASSFTPLWFLPCFFISIILFRLISNITKRTIVRILCLLVGILGFIGGYYHSQIAYGFPFNLDVALVGVLLMAIGYELKQISSSWILNNWGGVFCLIIGTLLAFLNLPDSITMGNPHVEMSIGAYGSALLFTITATLLCIAIISMSKLLSRVHVSKSIEFIGRNSMAFLCLHGFTNTLIISAFSYIHFKSPLVVCVLSIALCSLATIIINKNCPDIIGKGQ